MKKTLKICGRTIKIKEGELNDDESFGEYENYTGKIFISETVCTEIRDVTIAHEVLHALLDISGSCSILGKKEEQFVRSLENTFCDFLKKNTNFYEI